jgi:hypothetical protein
VLKDGTGHVYRVMWQSGQESRQMDENQTGVGPWLILTPEGRAVYRDSEHGKVLLLFTTVEAATEYAGTLEKLCAEKRVPARGERIKDVLELLRTAEKEGVSFVCLNLRWGGAMRVELIPLARYIKDVETP